MKRVLVTGGCGYTGTPHTLSLGEAGRQVTVFDTRGFGNRFPLPPSLTVIRGDMLNVANIPACDQVEAREYFFLTAPPLTLQLQARLGAS